MKNLRLNLLHGKLFFVIILSMITLSLPYQQVYATQEPKPLQVVASFTIIADLVEQIGGPKVQVSTLIQAGRDAHTFEPSAQDVRTLANAQLLFINGLEFEPWLNRLIQAANYQNPIVILTQGVTPRAFGQNHTSDGDHDEHDHDEHSHEGHHHGFYDPHAWQNPRNVMIYVQNIELALSQLDPQHTSNYHERALAYLQQLEELDQHIRQAINALPEQHRILVTTHESFGYFADAYGFTTLSPLGVSNEALPSAAGVATLIEQVRTHHIPALFIETTSNPRTLEQVARETQAIIGGKLYTDALTPKTSEGTPADTYIHMMQQNLNTLIQALTPKNTN